MRIATVVACFAPLFFVAAASRAEEPAIVVENCTLFDSAAGTMRLEQTIVVRGDTIQSVTGAGEALEVPADVLAGARRIDGRGKYVIPGLIDAHVHLVHVLDYAHMTGDEVLPLYLAWGVTSIRSTGDELVAATLVARAAENRPERSPRVFTCSPLLDNDPPIHRDVGRAIVDPAAVPALFDDLEPWRPATIKIYAGTARPVGKAIIDEAHRRGMFVTAHLGAYAAQDAVADGVDCLEHIWSVFNYVIPGEIAGQSGHRGRVSFETPLCEGLIAKLLEQKTYVDPTLAVFRNMILLPDVAEVRDDPEVLRTPKRLRDFWPKYLASTGCPQGGPLEDRRREFAKFQELVGKLHRAGVPILAGTDAPEPQVVPGYSLHQELELLVQSGLSPAAALQAATRNNAAALRVSDRLGAIDPGKQADLVILSADPLADIRHTRAIEFVIRSGRIATPSELFALVPAE